MPERADAARNRARILDAAAPLFAAAGGRALTMEAVAAAAGVGKATLYRRYPDVASIAVALLDAHERDLQDRILRGPPPLGPGAPPGDRLAAFYAAMVELLEAHGHLALAAETGARRFATGAYAAWALHVTALLDAAEADRAAPRARSGGASRAERGAARGAAGADAERGAARAAAAATASAADAERGAARAGSRGASGADGVSASRAALVHALLAPLAPEVFAHQRAAGESPAAIAAALAVVARGVLD